MMTIEIIDIVFTVLFDNSFFFLFDDVIAAFVVVVTDGAAVVITFAGFVGFNIQVRSDIRLPLNEMDSFLLHCLQFVQLVPIN